MDEATSDAGIFLNMTYHALGRMGVDRGVIFASVNLPDEAPDPEVRRDNSTQARFWRAAEEVTGDVDIGLRVGGHLEEFRGGLLEYLMLSSKTFGEGLRAALHYGTLYTNAMDLRLRVDGKVGVLSGLVHPVRHYLESFVCPILSCLRRVTDGDFCPLVITFEHGEGASSILYEQVYGAPVQLNAAEGAIHFDAKLLERPSLSADAQLFAVIEAHAAQRLADLGRASIINVIEHELAGMVEAGDVSLTNMAARLQRNPRTLRAGLAAQGTNFNRVVASYRERLARRLLSRTSHSIDQIVYLTGFSEPSAFARAFKRWTGETPTDYRTRKQANRSG